ncbi:Helitron helicase [Phytophthora megakarya]|uniref:Helitron helicase n=1 Tax=Phytophthora megakarya TaxID=4795 RepID=A0A225VBE1_9STRA|nr:Helitron helicase [Phytophthora megakarya]
MSGPAKRNTVFIPRIIFYTEDDDKEFPFKLKRKQFPVVSVFGMTINKAQGQSSHHVDIFLESPVFAPGQLNVAISRVTSQKAIKIAVDSEMIDVDGGVHIKNIVYKEMARYYNSALKLVSINGGKTQGRRVAGTQLNQRSPHDIAKVTPILKLVKGRLEASFKSVQYEKRSLEERDTVFFDEGSTRSGVRYADPVCVLGHNCKVM